MDRNLHRLICSNDSNSFKTQLNASGIGCVLFSLTVNQQGLICRRRMHREPSGEVARLEFTIIRSSLAAATLECCGSPAIFHVATTVEPQTAAWPAQFSRPAINFAKTSDSFDVVEPHDSQ